jgi:hypothetical protein
MRFLNFDFGLGRACEAGLAERNDMVHSEMNEEKVSPTEALRMLGGAGVNERE